MKNLKKTVFGILAMLVMVTSVNAESETVVSNFLEDVKYCSTEGNKITCNVNEDITLNEALTVDDKEVVINIENGKTLKLSAGELAQAHANDGTNNTAVIVKNGKLTISGGTVDATAIDNSNNWIIKVLKGGELVLDSKIDAQTTTTTDNYSVITAYDNAVVTLTANSEINSYNTGVAVNKGYEGDTTATVKIAGKITTSDNGVAINGQVTAVGSNITFEKTAEVTSDLAAIYAGGNATQWLFEGGKFTGHDALSIKSGHFTIKDGTFTANGNPVEEPQSNGNGEELTGAAVSITSHSGSAYAGDVTLKIENGSFTSEKGYAIYSFDRNGETSAFKDEHSVAIEDGTFTAAKREVVFLNANGNAGAKDQGRFINGGKFITTSKNKLNGDFLAKYFSEDINTKLSSDGTEYFVGEEVANNFTTIKVVAVQNDPVGTAEKIINETLSDLVVGSRVRLSEVLGINKLDYDAYKDYTTVITLKYGETEEVKTTKNYNKSVIVPIVNIPGFNIPVPGESSDMFVVPVEDVSITINFVKTEELNGIEYKVVVIDSENGELAVDKTVAKAGETVVVTANADEGYKVAKVFVNGVEITANEDGTYSFAMPAADVNVSATFAKIETPVDPGQTEEPGNNEGQKPSEEENKQPVDPSGDGETTDPGANEDNTPSTGDAPAADEGNNENPSTLDSIVSIVTLAISSLGTAGYSIKKFIRK